MTFVDWETIVIYTCPSEKCLPNFGKEEFYMKEYAYIQFSDDFEKVQYGTEEQIRKQQKDKLEQINEEQNNQPEDDDDGEAEKKRK